MGDRTPASRRSGEKTSLLQYCDGSRTSWRTFTASVVPNLLPFDAELRTAFDDDLFASQLSCSHADAGFRGRGLHKISHHLLAGLKANMITAPPRR